MPPPFEVPQEYIRAGINPSPIWNTPGKAAAPVTQILDCSKPELAKVAHKQGPLVIGDTFTIDSKILGETRRINVYSPPAARESTQTRLHQPRKPPAAAPRVWCDNAGLIADHAPAPPVHLKGLGGSTKGSVRLVG